MGGNGTETLSPTVPTHPTAVLGHCYHQHSQPQTWRSQSPPLCAQSAAVTAPREQKLKAIQEHRPAPVLYSDGHGGASVTQHSLCSLGLAQHT